ncbi:hypothetical protein VKT23_001530 [Stygiomarasmius scandens]|uniref:Uncharacterized protein n=1 Tax=Marasmiellus scandens TaxID=2682957 RepID=A0ABR1K2Y1_9AGAR
MPERKICTCSAAGQAAIKCSTSNGAYTAWLTSDGAYEDQLTSDGAYEDPVQGVPDQDRHAYGDQLTSDDYYKDHAAHVADADIRSLRMPMLLLLCLLLLLIKEKGHHFVWHDAHAASADIADIYKDHVVHVADADVEDQVSQDTHASAMSASSADIADTYKDHVAHVASADVADADIEDQVSQNTHVFDNATEADIGGQVQGSHDWDGHKHLTDHEDSEEHPRKRSRIVSDIIVDLTLWLGEEVKAGEH